MDEAVLHTPFFGDVDLRNRSALTDLFGNNSLFKSDKNSVKSCSIFHTCPYEPKPRSLPKKNMYTGAHCPFYLNTPDNQKPHKSGSIISYSTINI